MNIKFNKTAIALLCFSVFLTGCATKIENRWEERDNALYKKLADLDKNNPNPNDLLQLVRSFEENKNDFSGSGYIDYIYVRQMAIQQISSRLKNAIEAVDEQKKNVLIPILLELDPMNELLKSYTDSGIIPVEQANYSGQLFLVSRLTPTSALASQYNSLVYQSLLSTLQDGKQYKDIYNILNQPIKDIEIPISAPLQQQFAYLSGRYGFSFSYDPEISKVKFDSKFTKKEGSATLLDYLGDISQAYGINMIIFPDQVYSFAGDQPRGDIPGGEYMAMFKAEFISIDLLVAMLKLIAGDSSIVMVDENSRTVWLKVNRNQFMRAFDLVRSTDVPEAEIEVQLELYEVSASLLHNIGLRLPQLIRAGIGNAVDGGSMNWSTWLQNSRSQSMRMMISDGSFQLNAQSQNLYASTLSQPRIRVQDGQRARLFVGDKTPVFSSTVGQGGFVSESVNYVSTGVTLEVEAKIAGPDTVQVAVNIDATELGPLVTTTSGSSANAVTSRTTVTRLTIRDGNTEALGGYVRRVKTKNRDGMPLIGATELAPLGGLSSTRSNDVELLIFITPKIVKTKSASTRKMMMPLDASSPKFGMPLFISPNMNSPVRTLFQIPQIKDGQPMNMVGGVQNFNQNMNYGMQNQIYNPMLQPNQGMLQPPMQGMPQQGIPGGGIPGGGIPGAGGGRR